MTLPKKLGQSKFGSNLEPEVSVPLWSSIEGVSGKITPKMDSACLKTWAIPLCTSKFAFIVLRNNFEHLFFQIRPLCDSTHDRRTNVIIAVCILISVSVRIYCRQDRAYAFLFLSANRNRKWEIMSVCWLRWSLFTLGEIQNFIFLVGPLPGLIPWVEKIFSAKLNLCRKEVELLMWINTDIRNLRFSRFGSLPWG